MKFPRILALAALFAALSAPNAFAQALWTNNDCSIASLSGSSTQLLAANANRKYLLICNIGATGDNIGVNLSGGTAAIAGTGTITLVPGSCKEFAIAMSYLPNPPANAITVIGTSGQPVACTEGR